MASWLRVPFGSFAALFLTAAAQSTAHNIPEWLLGDWTPVEIFQDADTLYASRENEPKYWLAGQHLFVNKNSLTLADDRCENPIIVSSHDRPSVPIHEKGSGTIESLGLPLDNKPVDYLSFKCNKDVYKPRNEVSFVHLRDRRVRIT